MKKQTLAIAAISLATISASAQLDEGPARGRDIDPTAGSCNIGPFSQTAKAGSYNQLCATMTDSEKCLALIKGQMWEYEFSSVRGERIEIMEYCLDHLRSKLLPPPVTPAE